MTMRFACCLVIALCAAACDGTRNPDCAWRDEPAAPLDLHDAGDRRHLSADARLAEELAIRHADVQRGHRSGRFAGVDEYHRTRDRCFAALSGDIASRHHVTAAQVADAARQRNGRSDAAVLLIYVVLFVIAANAFARRLFIRFPADEPWPALIGTAAGAIAVSATGAILGGLGASIVEMIQLGDLHLSYRADRLPWTQHWLLIFAGGIALFLVIASIRWRRSPRVLR
jgi:hypothetical protein